MNGRRSYSALQILALAALLGLVPTAPSAQNRSVEARLDGSCRQLRGEIVVPPGCWASGFHSSINSPWLPCSGPSHPDQVGYKIKTAGGIDVFTYTLSRDGAFSERPVELKKVTLSPGTYYVTTAGGRDTTVAISFTLSGSGCGDPPHHGSAEGALVPPCAQGETLVRSLFRCILARKPSDQEVASRVPRLQEGGARKGIARDLFRSDEYIARRRGNREYVADLVRALLGREPSQEEIERKAARLREGTSRDQMLENILASEEYRAARQDCAQGTPSDRVFLSCKGSDNEEKRCCCFEGQHTYRFAPRHVSSVRARFDTGRAFNCRSSVTLAVDGGSGWKTIKTVQAVSSSGDKEVAPVEVVVPVGSVIGGFRISDGCACCIDLSEIWLE